jgi:rod shape-determining protein MreC
MRLIWWLATVMFVGFVTLLLSEQNALDPLKNATLTVSAPVEDTFRDAASPLSDIYEGIADRGELVRDNERLRDENETLKSQVADQQEKDLLIQQLTDALQIQSQRPDDQLVVANVVAEDPSGLKRSIAIDLGQSDGVDEGMVVLSRNGSLIGTVSLAFQDFAWIRLINDPESAVNAQVNVSSAQPGDGGVLTPGGQEDEPSATPAPSPEASPSASPAPPPAPVRGVAEGHLRDGIVLDLLPPESAIGPGALVVTSGLGGNYPPGLLIGTVTEVEQRPQAPFKKALVEAATRLDSLDTVLVLVNFKPARLEAAP